MLEAGLPGDAHFFLARTGSRLRDYCPYSQTAARRPSDKEKEPRSRRCLVATFLRLRRWRGLRTAAIYAEAHRDLDASARRAEYQGPIRHISTHRLTPGIPMATSQLRLVSVN